MEKTTDNPRWSVRARRTSMAYLEAKASVVDHGFASEIDWQHSVSLSALSEKQFIREAAWVILCSGFRESVLRRRFQDISDAFLNWTSAERIWKHRQTCRRNALSAFRYGRKIDAILTLCGYVARYGFDAARARLASDGIDFLTRFPFLGPATSRHLAKNLGLPTAKPDRHLIRVAAALGYPDVATLCSEIADVVGDPIAVVDVVLWRYATLVSDYLNRLTSIRYEVA